MALYDTIGRTYTSTRRPDPRIAARIEHALGDARTVLNVGAGAGSYESPDRSVLAVEPSRVMIGQRPAGAAPVIRAVAGALPFAGSSFDAATAFLTDHHWPDREAGFREMRRVARRIVVFQWDAAGSRNFWLTRDYLPGFEGLSGGDFPAARIAEVLGADRIEPLPIPADCLDGFYSAFWKRPAAYLDPIVRAGISVFARLDPGEVSAGMERLARDLASGEWADRNAGILGLDDMDLGYRLVIADRS